MKPSPPVTRMFRTSGNGSNEPWPVNKGASRHSPSSAKNLDSRLEGAMDSIRDTAQYKLAGRYTCSVPAQCITSHRAFCVSKRMRVSKSSLSCRKSKGSKVLRCARDAAVRGMRARGVNLELLIMSSRPTIWVKEGDIKNDGEHHR